MNLMVIQRPTTVSCYSYLPAVFVCLLNSIPFILVIYFYCEYVCLPPADSSCIFPDFTIEEVVEYIVLTVNHKFMFTYWGVSLESRVFTNWFVIEVKGTTSVFRKSIAVAISIKEPWLRLFCLAYCAAVSTCFCLLVTWS